MMKQPTITNDPPVADSQDRGEQVSIQKANAIKLGIDVHKAEYVVVRQVDQATPQPAQRFRPADFPGWVARPQRFAPKVYACYEAGFSGFGRCRELRGMGVECEVVCPQNWDERNTRVRNDPRDAKELVLRLDRYVNGNREALAVVRVPTAEEERAVKVGSGNNCCASVNGWPRKVGAC